MIFKMEQYDTRTMKSIHSTYATLEELYHAYMQRDTLRYYNYYCCMQMDEVVQSIFFSKYMSKSEYELSILSHKTICAMISGGYVK